MAQANVGLKPHPIISTIAWRIIINAVSLGGRVQEIEARLCLSCLMNLKILANVLIVSFDDHDLRYCIKSEVEEEKYIATPRKLKNILQLPVNFTFTQI